MNRLLQLLLLLLLAGMPAKPGAQKGPGGGDSNQARQTLDMARGMVGQAASTQASLGDAKSASLLSKMQSLLAGAQAAFDAGDMPRTFDLCNQIRQLLDEFHRQGSKQFIENQWAGKPDTGRMRGEQREQAQDRLAGLSERLNDLVRRMEAGKNPQAFELAERIRGVLESARREADAGRPANALPFLNQATTLLNDLGNLVGATFNPDKGGPGPGPDLFKDPNRPAGAQNNLVQAYDLEKRIRDQFMRLSESVGAANDPKAAQLARQVQDLLDKSREALSAGKADASKDLSLKAEALLAQLHLAVASSAAGDAGRKRLQDRLSRNLDLLRKRQADPDAGLPRERLAAAASLLDQARASLEAKNADAAAGLLGQAERILGSSAPAGGRLSLESFDRLRSKLDKAAGIVSASRDQKAGRILEKGMEHFGKAERYRSEGQAARAEIEMDIALKLAAKAVDLARSR